MLLTIKNLGGDITRDVVGDIIAENEGDSLSLLQVDMADDSFSKHSWPHLLLECYRWALSILFAVVNCNVQLQLDAGRCERDSLALEASRGVLREHNVGFVRTTSIIEGREDLDICEARC